ncbi:MAG: hypothetical protein QNJ34_18905 [Xenococcaceae cyanobacterium MO_188.B29]|nr:hypothetical protein [Xenococcaceae cyanobacterium MO_188.B29]
MGISEYDLYEIKQKNATGYLVGLIRPKGLALRRESILLKDFIRSQHLSTSY